MRSRIVVILIVLTSFWTLILGRAGYLQLVSDERLENLEKKQFETQVTLSSRRGDVTDRNGHELAVSMTAYSLFADPAIIEDSKSVVKLLSKELKMPAKAVEEKLKNKKKRFVWVQRRLDRSVRDTINEQKIRGLGFIEETQRIYPNDRLLSHVLGFVGGESQGLEGVELKYNDHLQATHKKVSLQKDARGRPLIVNGQIFNQAPDGADVQLTIDRELQFVLEQELQAAVNKHNADSAVGIVLDAQTSEVLAMGAHPAFDPNHAGDFPSDKKRNRPVTDSFEPGSTMKTFVIAGALAKGLVDPKTMIDCEGGKLKIGRRTINEADAKHRFKLLSVSEILAVSSNVGTTKIAFKLGAEGMRETYKNFGFGLKTGVDLPGEAKGIIQGLPWADHLLANISFGHGIAATALQVANAYASIANGGFLKVPYVVKRVQDHESGETIEMKPKTLRRVLSDDVVGKMRAMLTSVTGDEGTGVNARVPGYPVAGKTGTAQKVKPDGRGYLRGGYISSFAGFIPSNDPRFVIYIAVDHPRKEYYGSAVAAPVFSRVAGFAVRRAGIPPSIMEDGKVIPVAKVSRDVDGMLGEHGEEAASAPIQPVAEVTDEPPVSVQEEPRARIITDADIAPPPGAEPINGVVPDLAGLTLREVMSRVAGTGIVVKVNGQGFVKNTVPSAGAKISEGKELTVNLAQ